ncbi:MAG: FeoB-associated Cys-rich membrane protein [Lachnospiraceae bacterium]|nr:FeoB-associated Cys-rich membrane protein [Lachnospiraceae bacterium]
MLNWLAANAASIIVSIILAVLVIAIIVKLIRDKRNGKSSCGCSCTNCAMQGTCHDKKNL